MESRQTLFRDPGEMLEPDPVEEGAGRGSFIVVRGWKPPCPGPTAARSLLQGNGERHQPPEEAKDRRRDQYAGDQGSNDSENE